MGSTDAGGAGWSVYVVCCSDDSFYVGISNDVVARIAAHNAGRGARYTRPRRPVFCIWRCDTESAEEARRLEGLMKRLDRRTRARLVDGDVDLVDSLFAIVWSRMRSPAVKTGRDEPSVT